MSGEIAPESAKSSATKALIVDTALRLFAERGYDRTTMRAIATEAGVSVGNAYYYFSSKEHLVQGFYDRIADAHAAAGAEILDRERDFGSRLSGVMMSWLDVAQPYHQFGAQFFRNAADPNSPLSPFSRESGHARDAAIGILRDVVHGSNAKIDPELRRELPELLWLYQMGVVLYWVHDRSPDCRRTRLLVRRTVPLIDKVVGLSRLRVLRPLVRDAVQSARELLDQPDED